MQKALKGPVRPPATQIAMSVEASAPLAPVGVHAYAERSIVAGETVHFRISSDQDYQLSVCRLGADPDSGKIDTVLQSYPLTPAQVQAIYPGSYVRVDNALPAAQPLGAISLECWVRPWRTDVWQGLITQHTYPTECGFGLFLANGLVYAYLGDGGSFQGTGLHAGPPIHAHQWSHVVLTWDGSVARLYINGVNSSNWNWTFAGPLVPGPAPLRLAAYGSLDANGQPRAVQFLEGDLAVPVIYDHALGAQDITTRSSTLPPQVPAMQGVLACWPLTEEQGSKVADASPHARTGSIVNHASWMIGGPGYDAAGVPRYGSYNPLQDPTRGHGLRFASDDLYDCGWSVSQAFTVPANAAPGMYVGRIRVGGSVAYEVPFVVRRPPTRPRAQILVLCATNTWMAYSGPFDGTGPAFSCYATHVSGQPTFQLGLNMPMRAAGVYSLYSDASVGYSHLVRAERFLHQWLERNGYAYDLATDLDLHREPGLLTGYQVLVISGHSEYWSVPAWQAVDGFLSAGGSVASLSGNSLFWRVSFDASQTVMECRKYDGGQVFGGQLGGVGELWHSQDSQRGGLLREAGYPCWKLLGQEAAGFVATSGADFIPLTVESAGHFLFNTPHAVGVANGDAIGQAPGGGLPRAVGHEWDTRVTRLLVGAPPPGAVAPVEPAGIATLATARKSAGLLDYYGNWQSGTPMIISEITYWDRPQGGRVFYAGTIGTGWALSADVGLQRMMHNVLFHFGVSFDPVVPAAVVSPQGQLRLFHRGPHGALKDRSFDGVQWSPWHDVGTSVVGAPSAVAWGGDLTLLAVGTEGPLQSRWWNGTQWGPSDTDWQSLGGQVAGAPVAVSRAPFGNPNGFDVFALSRGGSIQHKWWDGAQWGPTASDWQDLGGALIASPAGINWGAYLTIMAVGVDGTLQVKYWDGVQWGPSATGWQLLGGQLAGPLVTVSRAPGDPSGFDIFALARDGTIQHKRWDGTQWLPTLGDLESLGGTFIAGPAAVAWGGGGKMTLFAVGTDQQMWTKWWDGAQWNPSPTGWLGFGGQFLGPVTAVHWGADRIDVFAVGTDRAVWTRWWDGAAWHPAAGWLSLGS